MLKVIKMHRGKRTGDEIIDDEHIIGILKAMLRVYRWPPAQPGDYVTERGVDVSQGILKEMISNDPLKFLVRLYVVKGINLRPLDPSGKSDPYLIIKLNDNIIDDKENCITSQTNPIFGRVFEFNGTFPQEYLLEIQVWDRDVFSRDDFVGETKIDLENRFFTKHRASCGLSKEYSTNGYNAWRDSRKPSQILSSLCKMNHLSAPIYSDESVKIGSKQFSTRVPANVSKSNAKEVISLHALHNWHEMPLVGCTLVPEHVETRSLHNSAIPGIEQGKLQLWVDIFICNDFPPPKAVEIKPRSPVDYELRVIIWNTEDVILSDTNYLTGERVSDIYIRGWLTDTEPPQTTDIHYHSLTGDGKFNWRFIFRFNFLSTENKMTITRKDNVFSATETDYKVPCVLHLQVWDSDTITSDDFLGSTALELSCLPRGSKTAPKCKPFPPNTPVINLFKTHRCRGWWPVFNTDEKSGNNVLTGKVEVEFHLLTKEEAATSPVGMGRNEPQALPAPKRPDTSISWLRDPLRAITYVLCYQYRWRVCSCIIYIMFIGFILIALYSVPGYTVKKLLKV